MSPMKHRVEPVIFNFANGPTGDQRKEKQMNDELRVQQQEDDAKDRARAALLNRLVQSMLQIKVDPEVIGAYALKDYVGFSRECFK